MCSRGVWQLQRVVLRYHWHRGASAGCRDFVRSDIVEFAKANPQVNIETMSTRGTPTLTGEYLNGNSKVLNVGNMDRRGVQKKLMSLRDSLGEPNRKYKKSVYSQRPSVQGVWDPSTRFDDFQLEA